MLTLITSRLGERRLSIEPQTIINIFVFPFPESLLLSVSDCFVVIIVIVAGSESFGLKNKNYFSPFIKKSAGATNKMIYSIMANFCHNTPKGSATVSLLLLLLLFSGISSPCCVSLCVWTSFSVLGEEGVITLLPALRSSAKKASEFRSLFLLVRLLYCAHLLTALGYITKI